jgi:RNA polymerase sigma-70 factor (ECF subfamily)
MRHGARRPQSPLEDVPAARHPIAPDPADLALENLSTESAVALVSRLPRLQAEVILLRVVAGLDTDSVGHMLGRSPGAIRVATHRGLKRLAEIAEQAGVTL